MENRVERLKLVFALDPTPIKTESFKLRDSSVVVKTQKPLLDHVTALQKVIEVMHALGIAVRFKSKGSDIAISTLLAQVERTQKWGQLETAELSFQFGIVGGYDQCFITITENVAGAAINWDAWAKPFLEEPSFVQAWIHDVEYDYWQNAKDVLQYKVAKRDYSHLPMVSNGLPPPVEQKIIDTSKNPGRWTIEKGYVEAVGATMWLGPLFWDRIGHDSSEQIKSTEWLQSEVMDNGILRIQAQPNSFQDDSTADLQNRLRECLYFPLNGP